MLDLLGDLPEDQVTDEMAVILAGVGQRYLDCPAEADPGCMKQRTALVEPAAGYRRRYSPWAYRIAAELDGAYM